MKKLFFIFAISLFSASSRAYFYELKCDANFQETVGGNTIKVDMNVSQKNTIFLAVIDTSDFKAEFDQQLDTIYVTIKKDQKIIAFTTLRVPTFIHNDSMADIRLEDGTRRWVSCAYVLK